MQRTSKSVGDPRSALHDSAVRIRKLLRQLESERRVDWEVMGDAVQIAAKLEKLSSFATRCSAEEAIDCEWPLTLLASELTQQVDRVLASVRAAGDE